MKKNHFKPCRKVSVYSLVLTLLFFALTPILLAQPTWSRGEQLLPITYEEAMRRAKSALLAEGYGAMQEGGAMIAGQKDIHTAVIMCNVAPEGKIWINIVVASIHNEGTVPGAERVRLQNRMNQNNIVNGNLVGEWNLKCCNDYHMWTLHITSQDGTNFSGSFSGGAGDGAVNGQVRGNTIDFVRSGGWGKQQWSAQLVNDGGGLRMISGVWTGEFLANYPGRNNWHAEKK
ncbi:MAG: hypothetical protein H7Y01_14270 [Ferruginibacter sp.]|nr:hypothetical protein [Chitinophagaceae bacterium]